MLWRPVRRVAGLSCLLAGGAVLAGPGPGINQPTFLPSEVGTEIFNFTTNMTGGQPTMVDFQHGYLYVGSAHSLDNTITSKAIWINFTNPRSPSVITQINTGGNKPHMAAFFRDRMVDGFQSGNNFRIWDFDDKVVVNTYSGTVNPVWYMCQFPYVFRPRNGYATNANLMEIANMRTGNGSQIALLDLGATLGFAVGSSHAVGNLLICSASQAKGVATFDISDPVHPVLLDQLVTGNPVYTSMVHGSRVYQCETGAGIRVYDFSDPANIQNVGFIDLPDNPRYVMLKDGKGYCCPGAAKLCVFNATTLAIQTTYTLAGKSDFAQLIGNMAITGGNEGANRCSVIPIQTTPDTNGPVAQFVSPANNAVSQALSTRVGLIMSDQIDVTSLTTNTFIVRPLGGNAVPGTYSTQMGMINFAPDQPLNANTTYEVVLSAGGIRDVAGNGLATGFLSRFATGSAVDTNVITDLIARWPFDNSTNDISGNNHHVQLVNGAAFSTNFAEGTHSVALDGANDYVNGGAIPLGNQFTLAMWVRIPTGATNIQTLAANSGGGFTANGFRFFVNTYQTANRRILIETGNGTSGLSFSSTTNVVDLDQWNHIALVADRTAGTGKIYYRGSEVASGTVRTDFANNALLAIGAFNGGSFPLKGNLDDVRIYNRTLSSNEIVTLAASPNVPPVVQSVTATTTTPLVGQSVTFTNNATDANLADTLTYSFNFGDGTAATAFSTNRTAQHTYSAPGRYTIIGRVSDGSVTVSKNLMVIVHHALTSPGATASSQIIFDTGRGKVWCVNPDSDTLSRIHATTLAKELEIAVGTKPRSVALKPDGSAIWAACEKSDELWVLDANTGALLTRTNLGYGVAPTAVAFAPNGSAAFVAAQGAQSLLKLNPTTLAVTGSCQLSNAPSSLAVSGDSARVLVSRFISQDTRGEVWEVNASTMSLTRTFGLAFDNSPDGENSGRGVPNYLMQVAFTPDGRRAWIPSKKDNIARGTFRDGQPLNHQNTVRSILSQLDLLGNVESLTNRIDVDNHSLPGAVCFSPLGDLSYVAYQGNNEIRVFDTVTGNNLTSVDTGFAPQSVCLNSTGSRLYVMNFLSRSISVFDVSQLGAGLSSAIATVGETNVVSVEKLATNVLAGKRIFYNAADERMANEGYLTCVSCHLGGDTDGRVWDFTDRGEGLRNTTSLQGRRGMGHGRVHWSANFDEIQDFEHDIRNAFGGTGFMSDAAFNTGTRNSTLGDPKAGVSAELDALAAYVSSLTDYPKSAQRETNGSLTAVAQNGRQHFQDLQCYACHGGADFTDSAIGVLRDIGTIKASSGHRLGGVLPGIDTPTLRGLASTPPYLHDGSATNLSAVFDAINATNGSPHASFRTLNPTEQNELLEYLLEIDGSEPAAPVVIPEIAITQIGGSVLLSWQQSAPGFGLFSTTGLEPPATWTQVTNALQQTGGVFSVTLPMTDGKRFFRLQSN
jgi:DNA-binding beta-propeller fold protein YncE